MPEIDRLIAQLREAATQLDALCRQPTGSVFLRLKVEKMDNGDGTYRYVHAGLERAIRQVEDAKPRHTVCPYSYSGGEHPKDYIGRCPVCLDQNWTAKLPDNIPPNLKAKVQAAFGLGPSPDTRPSTGHE